AMRRDTRAQIGIGNAAVLLARILLCDFFQFLASAAPEPAGGNVLPLVLQQPLGDVPAAVQLADQILFRHLHIGEEGFAERRRAGDQLYRPRLDTRRLHIEQDERNAFVLLRGVGADEAENPIGLIGVAGPDLLAVDE